MKRRIPLRRRLLFLAIVFVATLGVAEILLRVLVPFSDLLTRNEHPEGWFVDHHAEVVEPDDDPRAVFDPVLGWTLRPDVWLPDLWGGYSTNSRGLRGTAEHAIPKPAGLRRGLVLGDSFSTGVGVADDETYAARMQSMLANTEVLNLAVPGYGIDQAVLRFEAVGRDYEPDFVVLTIYIDDFNRNFLRWRFSSPKPRFAVHDGQLRLTNTPLPRLPTNADKLAHVEQRMAPLLRLPRVWLAGRYLTYRVANKLRDHREPDATFLAKAAITRLLIARLATHCAERNIGLVVTFIPNKTDFPDKDRIIATIEGATRAAAVPFLAFDARLGATAEQMEAQPIYDPATGHWSALGHRLAAVRIIALMRRHDLLD